LKIVVVLLRNIRQVEGNKKTPPKKRQGGANGKRMAALPRIANQKKLFWGLATQQGAPRKSCVVTLRMWSG